MSDSQDPRPVPEADAAQFLTWLYANPTLGCVTGAARELLPLPAPDVLINLLDLAVAQGNEWILVDGPRPMRNTWMLDPWWPDQPELTPKLTQRTRAAGIRIAAAVEILRTLVPSSDGQSLRF